MVRDNDKVVFGVLSGVALLIPLILTLSEGWSWWYLLLGAVLLAAVAVLRTYLTSRRHQQASSVPPLERPSVREVPNPPASEPIPEVDLPTDTPEYSMIFSATVKWQPTPDPNQPAHGDPGALAKQAIIERAAAAVREVSPSDATAAPRLAGLLGVPRPDRSGQLRAWATDVKLTIRDEDAARIRALSDLRKKCQVWEQEREHERNVRAYLGEDVLRTSGRALVWWLARHVDDIEGSVALINDLSRLSAASQDREDLGTFGPHVVAVPSAMHGTEDRDLTLTRDLLNELFPDSSDQRALFARKLARLADECEQNGYGCRLRQMFGVPDVHEALPDIDDDGEPTSA